MWCFKTRDMSFWELIPVSALACFAFVLSKNGSSVLRWIFSPMIARVFLFFQGQVFKCASHPLLPSVMLQRLICSSQGWVSFYLIDLRPIIVSLQVIQAVFFGICVLTDLSSLLTRGSGNQEQERQLKKLISLRDWMLAVLAFPVGVVSMM